MTVSDAVSAGPSGDHPDPDVLDDRSTRARIRDAALAQFAAHGFKGASIRGIAHAAGVSPGAVQTHFPTKDALREACDTYVLAVFRQLKRQLAGDVQGFDPAGSGLSDPAFMAGVQRMMEPIIDYLAISMVSDSDAARRWFDEFHELVRETLTDPALGPGLADSPATRDIAAVLAAMQLGLTMLYDHVLRAMGTTPDDPAGMVRTGHARLFLATQRFVSEAFEARARAALDSYAHAYGAGDETATPEGHA